MAKKENTIPTIIDTPEALTAKIAAMKEAQKIFATFTQEQVDKIFKAAATAADKARIPLAKDAVEETGMGIVEDKVIKNHYAAEYVYNAYKNTRTCGVIEEDTAYGIKKIAEPIGLIAAVIPTTNPTSTAIFKTLIALKTRNAIIISPHPRAKKCTIEAAKVVLEAAVEAGAPEEILYQQKPHLGTDVLVGVVETLRHQIEEMGGRFCFRSKVTELFFENDRLKEIQINDKENLPAEVCVLAVGHSARDSFYMFHKKGIYMEPKSFAVGVRIEHPQKMINMALYGEEENLQLGAAAYKVTHTCENGRGVYSFCMCPGGYVVNASSESGRLAVNGMSYQARDSKNANSAMIVSVTPDDFLQEGPLGGVEFQRSLEQAAWKAGNGRVPVQLFGDYQNHKASTALGDVTPCIKGAYQLTDVRSIFPKEIGDSIEEGILASGRKIKGFDRSDAVLSGIESRTSSPVRIVRDKDSLEANYQGIYPCGEGAGYAGGITSAAMDGIKVAEAISKKFINF